MLDYTTTRWSHVPENFYVPALHPLIQVLKENNYLPPMPLKADPAVVHYCIETDFDNRWVFIAPVATGWHVYIEKEVDNDNIQIMSITCTTLDEVIVQLVPHVLYSLSSATGELT